MPNRFYLSGFALAGAFLGAQVAAHAQTEPLPAAPPALSAPEQPGVPDAGQRRAHPLDRALQRLNLSSQQREQIRQIRESYRASRATGTRETRPQMLGQIRGVLTPQQSQEFDQMMQRRRAAN